MSTGVVRRKSRILRAFLQLALASAHSHAKVTSMDEAKKSEISRLRIVDASINRASEGLRVVEDFARMSLSDAFLSAQLKKLRHDLKSATDGLDLISRIQARESQLDVGRSISTDAEYERSGNLALIASNMARVQQALRTIEENCKSYRRQIAASVEQLRYRTYTLEKAIISTLNGLARLDNAHLYVLVDSCRGDHEKLRRLCSGLAQAGVGLIQLRDKQLSDPELLAAGKTITQAIMDTSCRWIMNDRADLAAIAGACGVHLGQDDIGIHDARKILGPGKLIGLSTHCIEQARQAVIDGADYIGVGPVFPSKTKTFDQFPGLEFVAQVSHELAIPAFAIGGIDLSNVDQIVASGCNRIAVASVIWQANDVVATAMELRQRLNLDSTPVS